MAAEGSAEDAADYLSRTNFKSLIEWLTAEAILNRPDDPLPFLRDLVQQKVAERPEPLYKPTDATDYVRKCYAEASASADEEGRIHGKVIKSSNRAEESSMAQRLALLEKLIDASKVIAMQLDPFEATACIIKESCRLLQCDRATLFTLDRTRNELILLVAEGAKEIRLPVGKGIAGTVAATGEIINIPDAYQDSRFDTAHDKKSGYRTNTILAAPILNGKGEITGVLQAINSSKGPFTDVDEEVVGILAAQAGIALHNANIYHLSVRAREKIKSLLDVIKAMHSDMGINSLMFTITERTHTLVDADRGTLFLADTKSGELWSMQGEINIRIPITAGIAGTVATTGQTINIPDAYKDSRFNPDVDKKSGYHTKHILCMPIRGAPSGPGQAGAVIGVIQVINKKMGVFDEEDENIMDSFLSIAGPILENSQLFNRADKAEDGTEFSGRTLVRKSSGAQARGGGGAAIIEEEEEEEDE